MPAPVGEFLRKSGYERAMKLPVRLSDVPSRIAAGAFIVNSGLTKLKVDEEHAVQLHGMATTAYPFLKAIPPTTFARLLAASELALGTSLLLPVVPTAVAGAGLAAFAGGLFGLYLRMPGTHEPGSLRPTEKGLALAKDVWLLGMGLSLVAAGFEGARHRVDARSNGRKKGRVRRFAPMRQAKLVLARTSRAAANGRSR
jgi:hypothetical protein